jgi:CBS domain-containing protein
VSVQNILDSNRAEVVTISLADTLKSAADRMRAHKIGALVVKSGAAVAGLILDRQIVNALSRHGERALQMAVHEIMTIPQSQLPRTIL